MNVKLLFVLFLSVALLVSMTEAGKDRRKKQKQKERNDSEDETAEETGGERGLDKNDKQNEKERSSVLEKQAEKKEEESESSSEEKDDDSEEDKNNGTVIIRKHRHSDQVTRFVRATRTWGAQVVSSDDGWVLPTDHPADSKVKRDTTEIQRSKELNDGAQIPLEKKPAATAAPSN